VKKLLIALVALVVLAAAAIVVTPMVYDVDAKLRPQIEAEAAKNLNGTLKIGKMSLNLLRGVFIEIDGVDLKASGLKDSVVKAEKASLEIPFASLLGGELQVKLNLVKPEINVIKDKSGKFNFNYLIKDQPAAANQNQGPQGQASASGPANLSFLNNVDLDVAIHSATIVNKDFQTGFSTTINDYSLRLENLGFGKDINLEASAKLNVKPTKDILLDGVVKIKGQANVEWGSNGFQSLLSQLELDLSQTKAVVKGLVNKNKGVPLTLDLTAKMNDKSIQLEALDFVVNDLRLKTTGSVSSFDPLRFDLKVDSSLMNLEQWQKIVVPLGQFQVAGILSMNLELKGGKDSLQYGGNIHLTEGGVSLPGFKNPVSAIRASLNLSNDNLKIKEISALIGSSSINLNGSLKNFNAPNISIGLYSPNISASDFIAPMSDEEKRAKVEAAKQDQPELTEEQIQKMVMGPIDQLKQIPILRKLKLKANVKVDQLYYEKINASNFVSDIEYAGLVVKLSKARMDIFNGKTVMVSTVDIRGAKPKYLLKAKTAKLDTVAFTEAFMAQMKGSLTGLMSADFNIDGMGASKSDLKTYLKGSGGFKLENGTWSGLQAMKMVGEKLSSIKGAKKAADSVKIGNQFKTFEGKFNIANGKFNLTNLIMDLTEARTAITGRGSVDFDMNTNMVASILAPLHNPPKKIQSRDGRAELPIEITGKITSPKIGWEKMLRKVAGAYIETKAKKEAKKAIEKEAQKLLDSKKAKDFMKKLGL
jgi:hypothetical protein